MPTRPNPSPIHAYPVFAHFTLRPFTLATHGGAATLSARARRSIKPLRPCAGVSTLATRDRRSQHPSPCAGVVTFPVGSGTGQVRPVAASKPLRGRCDRCILRLNHSATLRPASRALPFSSLGARARLLRAAHAPPSPCVILLVFLLSRAPPAFCASIARSHQPRTSSSPTSSRYPYSRTRAKPNACSTHPRSSLGPATNLSSLASPHRASRARLRSSRITVPYCRSHCLARQR